MIPAKFSDCYIDFLTPGILVMTALYNVMNGGAMLNSGREKYEINNNII